MATYDDIVGKTIHYPPTGFLGEGPTSICVPYGEDINLAFDHPGVFTCSNEGAFNPSLPPIYLNLAMTTATLGPFKATNSDQDVPTTFFDFSSGGFYQVVFQIRANCPDQDRK